MQMLRRQSGVIGDSAIERMMQIDYHHHAGLHCNAIERNEADPDSNREVVVEKVDQVDSTYQSKRDREHDDHRLLRIPHGHVEHQKYRQEDNRQNNRKSLLGAYLVFVLAAPFECITGRQIEPGGQALAGFADKSPHVAPPDIQENDRA